MNDPESKLLFEIMAIDIQIHNRQNTLSNLIDELGSLNRVRGKLQAEFDKL